MSWTQWDCLALTWTPVGVATTDAVLLTCVRGCYGHGNCGRGCYGRGCYAPPEADEYCRYDEAGDAGRADDEDEHPVGRSARAARPAQRPTHPHVRHDLVVRARA